MLCIRKRASFFFFFFFSSRRRHTRWNCDWSSDVCSSDLFWFAATISHRPRREGGDRKHPDQPDSRRYDRQRSLQEATDFRAVFACKHLHSPSAERSGWIINGYPTSLAGDGRHWRRVLNPSDQPSVT